ncbi:MAG: NACHT domain-containing protein [Elainellaceae cyanobacterium]
MTGSEPLWLIPAINAIAGLVVKTLGEMGNRSIDEPIKQKVFDASRQYVKKYQDRHGNLNVLGMSQPIPLEQIYTAVRLLDASELKGYETVESLETSYRGSNRRGFRRDERQKQRGIDVANKQQFLTVLGSPGIGKSTFLRRTGLEALKNKQGEYRHAKIPVFLELKRFDSDTINVEQQIIAEFSACGFPDPEGTTNHHLKHGKLLILLDGLDEVPSRNLTQVIRSIEDFVAQYDQNRFITSCRIAAYHNFFKRFTSVAIAEFDEDQIEQFISNWFRSELDQQSGTAQRCWDLLQRPENAAAKELAQTPLLLTFICLVYDRSQNLPSNRSVLYGKALDILLEEWAAEKRLERNPIYEGFHTGLEKELLAEIAYCNFKNDQLFFSEGDVIAQITDFLSDTLDTPNNLNGKSVLNAIEVQQGILVERAEDVYSFSHLTLQEYLTALYIDKHRIFGIVIREHLTDERWREVFLLVAGMMGSGVNDLLFQIERQARTLINTSEKAKQLVQWAEHATANSTGDYKGLSKRAAALAIASDIVTAIDIARADDITKASASASAKASAKASVIDRANVKASVIDSDIARARAKAKASVIDRASVKARAKARASDIVIGIDIASASASAITSAIVRVKASDSANNSNDSLHRLGIFNNESLTQATARLEGLRARMPGVEDSSQTRQTFADAIWETWLGGLQLTPDLINLSTQEWEVVSDYLYATKLLIDCKDAAVRVSKKTWEEIENRLLTV